MLRKELERPKRTSWQTHSFANEIEIGFWRKHDSNEIKPLKRSKALCRAADSDGQVKQSMHSFRLMSCPVMGVKESSKKEKWKTTISKFNFPFPTRCERKSFYLFDILKGRTWPGESITKKKVNRSFPSNNSFAQTLGYAAWRRQKKSFPRMPSFNSFIMQRFGLFMIFLGISLPFEGFWLEHAFASSGNMLGSGFV